MILMHQIRLAKVIHSADTHMEGGRDAVVSLTLCKKRKEIVSCESHRGGER